MCLTISIHFTRFQLLKFKPILKRRKESQVLLVTLFVYPHFIPLCILHSHLQILYPAITRESNIKKKAHSYAECAFIYNNVSNTQIILHHCCDPKSR